MPDERIAHHDLCFGCGLANVFGLHLEAESAGEKAVAGRFFVKQDHQGGAGNVAHSGVIAAALDEAMALAIHAAGLHAVTVKLDVSLQAPAPVGAFVRIAGRIDDHGGKLIRASAAAFEDSEGGQTLAVANGEFALLES